ncbi:hypothetical protein FB45DRAFT_1122664 [Roridomyces roridus]|uniref:Uncharacterized protein n=1 Tax=Roridomyces roridus TaxID=1738132 RepID=A0AAD7B3Y4_9AGAR|nr:hypothetical protein FB45DRAFT_1122664 [Roridomyces roridus]
MCERDNRHNIKDPQTSTWFKLRVYNLKLEPLSLRFLTRRGELSRAGEIWSWSIGVPQNTVSTYFVDSSRRLKAGGHKTRMLSRSDLERWCEPPWQPNQLAAPGSTVPYLLFFSTVAATSGLRTGALLTDHPSGRNAPRNIWTIEPSPHTAHLIPSLNLGISDVLRKKADTSISLSLDANAGLTMNLDGSTTKVVERFQILQKHFGDHRGQAPLRRGIQQAASPVPVAEETVNASSITTHGGTTISRTGEIRVRERLWRSTAPRRRATRSTRWRRSGSKRHAGALCSRPLHSQCPSSRRRVGVHRRPLAKRDHRVNQGGEYDEEFPGHRAGVKHGVGDCVHDGGWARIQSSNADPQARKLNWPHCQLMKISTGIYGMDGA